MSDVIELNENPVRAEMVLCNWVVNDDFARVYRLSIKCGIIKIHFEFGEEFAESLLALLQGKKLILPMYFTPLVFSFAKRFKKANAYVLDVDTLELPLWDEDDGS